MSTLKGGLFSDRANFFARLLPTFLDTIDKQALLSPDDIDVLRQSRSYFQKDRIDQVKAAAKRIKIKVSSKTGQIAFAIG